MTISTRFLGAFICLLVSLAGCNSEPTEITQTIRQTTAPDSQYQGPVADKQDMMNLFDAKAKAGKATPASPKAVSLPLPYNTVNLADNLAQPMQSAGSPEGLQLVIGFDATERLYYDFAPVSERKSSLATFKSVVLTDQR